MELANKRNEPQTFILSLLNELHFRANKQLNREWHLIKTEEMADVRCHHYDSPKK
jgi:hypothetical protein